MGNELHDIGYVSAADSLLKKFIDQIVFSIGNLKFFKNIFEQT